MREGGPIYLLKLQAVEDSDRVHDVRALLKALARRYGFRCLEIRELGEKESCTERD